LASLVSDSEEEEDDDDELAEEEEDDEEDDDDDDDDEEEYVRPASALSFPKSSCMNSVFCWSRCTIDRLLMKTMEVRVLLVWSSK